MSIQYRTCPHCGANLDPGEPCDCQKDHSQKDKKPAENAAQPAEPKNGAAVPSRRS